jgi:hypothetical protein
MALTDYKKVWDNSYEEVFQKTPVAKEIMNTRYESSLKMGASIERAIIDISGVIVRSVTRNAASVIDSINDTTEFLTINLEKELVFPISDGEVTQTGEMNAAQQFGKQTARKLMLDLDGRCFAEVRNAQFSFDNGDLAGNTASGVPITLNSTTVPQMVTRMGAKLRNRNNQDISTNMVFVVDSYAAADITQFIIGKNIDLAGNTFTNGYSGDVQNARLYVSENLQGEATLVSTGVFADNDTVTINGVVLTMKTALSAVAGQVLIGAAATNSIQNLAALINAPTVTTATGVAITASADLEQLAKVVATATNATTLTIVGTGTGRFILNKSAANFTWATSFIHAYFGKKGAIDLVIQASKEVDMRVNSDRRSTNIFSSYLAGIKTFADGAKKFLDVKINAL